MPTEKKAKLIDEIEEVLSKCNVGILTDYRGLKTAELNELRKKLREAGVEYRVVKNTLAQFAAKRMGRDDLADSLEGPIAVALGYGEISDPARIIADYIRTSKSTLRVKGGFLPDCIMNPKEVETLATLPGRDVLISQVIAGVQSPIASIIGVLAAPIRGVVGVLQARIQQLEGE